MRSNRFWQTTKPFFSFTPNDWKKQPRVFSNLHLFNACFLSSLWLFPKEGSHPNDKNIQSEYFNWHRPDTATMKTVTSRNQWDKQKTYFYHVQHLPGVVIPPKNISFSLAREHHTQSTWKSSVCAPFVGRIGWWNLFLFFFFLSKNMFCVSFCGREKWAFSSFHFPFSWICHYQMPSLL